MKKVSMRNISCYYNQLIVDFIIFIRILIEHSNKKIKKKTFVVVHTFDYDVEFIKN